MDIEKEIASKYYRFAKSMPKIPHSYSRRSEWENDNKFNEAVLYIRKHGKKEKFYNKEFIYLYIDNYKYWTMGYSVEKTILINRVKLNESSN